MITINKNPSASDLRTFALGIILGFAVLAALCWWVMPWLFGVYKLPGAEMDARLHKWHMVAMVLGGIGLAVAGIATLTPRSIGVPFYVVWMQIAVAIGNVTTPIFFTILFVVMLPLFSLIRLKDPLRFKLKPGPNESYWEEHKFHEDTIERAMRPF